MRYFVEHISLCEIGLPYSNFVILIPKKTSLAGQVMVRIHWPDRKIQ